MSDTATIVRALRALADGYRETMPIRAPSSWTQGYLDGLELALKVAMAIAAAETPKGK